jgi:hypothetical protein
MTAGDIYTVAGDGQYYYRGDGGPATQAQIGAPGAVALDGAGNLVLTDTLNNRVRVVAASTGTFYGQQMTAGYIYTVAGDGRTRFNGNGIPALQAGIHQPYGVTVDSAGNLLVTDTRNNRVRVVAERTGTFYGRPMIAGDIYTLAGNGTAGFSGDGGPATQAWLNAPLGVSVDGAGNVLAADTGNNRVRVVAEHTGTFYGQPMTAGHIYAIAGGGSSYPGDGGPATSGALAHPQGLAVDAAGSILLADGFGNRVRMVAERTGTFYGLQVTAGDIYTLAGGGTSSPLGDGGPATGATLSYPQDAAAGSGGSLLIADWGNGRVRMVSG